MEGEKLQVAFATWFRLRCTDPSLRSCGDIENLGLGSTRSGLPGTLSGAEFDLDIVREPTAWRTFISSQCKKRWQMCTVLRKSLNNQQTCRYRKHIVHDLKRGCLVSFSFPFFVKKYVSFYLISTENRNLSMVVHWRSLSFGLFNNKTIPATYWFDYSSWPWKLTLTCPNKFSILCKLYLLICAVQASNRKQS